MHPDFIEILDMASEAGYKYSFVSNGWNFTEIYEKLLPYREKLRGITFSLDGAREEIHDRLRGKGSFRRVMKAISICLVKDIPFNFNSVIISYNCNALEDMAEFTTKLGGCGLRFGHLVPTPSAIRQNLVLSPEERRIAEAAIVKIQGTSQLPVFMAPGNYTTSLFPCAPLEMQEFNIDWRGNVTMCCLLSGHGEGAVNKDAIGNLDDMSFAEAFGRLEELNRRFRQEKADRFDTGKVEDSDYFPCWYCLNYFEKAGWLKNFPENAWSQKAWTK